MFRRLYWIAEQLNADGSSRVTGIYTSIQDLCHNGLQWSSNCNTKIIRLTLMKPDVFDQPLGSWVSPGFGEIATDIQAFVESNEYTEEEVKMLLSSISGFVA
ncbi:MAG: hypothetical protein ABL949_08260 [Fimbriimonadaceae bacterium]